MQYEFVVSAIWPLQLLNELQSQYHYKYESTEVQTLGNLFRF